MKRNYFFSVITFVFFSVTLFSQNLTQSIKGRVTEKFTGAPVSMANIIIISNSPQKGTLSNNDGYFTLENIPVGRIDIMVSLIGYKPVRIDNLALLSGKELFVRVQIEEDLVKIREVAVKSHKRKDQPKNDMAMISARSFTVEETERYAGSGGDLAKMARNFAGVSSVNDNRNDIVIRGNAPVGLLWQMEGVPVPSPNHFASLGSSGGSISILSHNTLSNSDFMTGAWPAEYGNSVSGVFDLKLRNGNFDKQEYYGEISFNGLQFGAEGPLGISKHSSYLVNYRYSTLAAMEAMNINFIGVTPEYHDLTFKASVPTGNYGRFLLAGFGGSSHIEFLEKEQLYGIGNYEKDRRINPTSKVGAVILSHQHFFNPTTRINTFVSLSGTYGTTRIDSIYTNDKDRLYFNDKHSDQSYSIGIKLMKKINARNKFAAGLIFRNTAINYNDSVLDGNIYRKTLDTRKSDLLVLQGYSQLIHRFINNLSAYMGIYSQQFLYNRTWSVDPRFSVRWKINNRHTMSFGYGHHSQMQPLYAYFSETRNADGTYSQTNNDLKMTKSHHYIVSHQFLVNDDFRIKSEVYYQRLYNIPIESTPSDFSMTNYGAGFFQQRVDSLINKGTGTNYGIELTVEKFFTDNYYFLLTGCLYNSNYQTLDGIERNTLFNGNFALNILAGYEKELQKNNVFALNARFIIAGGNRYRVLNEDETIRAGEEIYDESKSYVNRLPDYTKIDISVSYKINRLKVSHEFILDLQNVTNTKNLFDRQWNFETSQMDNIYQTGFQPNILYRIYF